MEPLNHDGIVTIIKIPYSDVYCTTNHAADTLKESEYYVPDIIYPEEMIASFQSNDFKEVYSYLKNEVGLNISSKDLAPSGAFIDERYYGDVSEFDDLEASKGSSKK